MLASSLERLEREIYPEEKLLGDLGRFTFGREDGPVRTVLPNSKHEIVPVENGFFFVDKSDTRQVKLENQGVFNDEKRAVRKKLALAAYLEAGKMIAKGNLNDVEEIFETSRKKAERFSQYIDGMKETEENLIGSVEEYGRPYLFVSSDGVAYLGDEREARLKLRELARELAGVESDGSRLGFWNRLFIPRSALKDFEKRDKPRELARALEYFDREFETVPDFNPGLLRIGLRNHWNSIDYAREVNPPKKQINWKKAAICTGLGLIFWGAAESVGLGPITLGKTIWNAANGMDLGTAWKAARLSGLDIGQQSNTTERYKENPSAYKAVLARYPEPALGFPKNQIGQVNSIFDNVKPAANDGFVLKQILDISNIPEVNMSGLSKLMQNFGRDPDLAFRAAVAGNYLRNVSDAYVKGNIGMVNDAIDAIMRHRLANGGLDDPSGFASVTDLAKLMYYRNFPGLISLEDGSQVTRKQLSDSHINTAVAVADNSFTVLPQIGDRVIDTGDPRNNPALAPYSQSASRDPREFDQPTPNRFQPYNGMIPWVKGIGFVPTNAAADLDRLKEGRLDRTPYRYSYTPEERRWDINQTDEVLVYKADIVDKAPIQMRPFSQYIGSYSDHIESRGIDDYVASEESEAEIKLRNLGYVLPPNRQILFFASGVEYVINPINPNGEYFEIFMLNKIKNPDENYTPPYPYSKAWAIINGNIITFGEPLLTPKEEFPFVDAEKTRYMWVNLPGYSDRGAMMYGTGSLFIPNLADEGDCWLKVTDNTDLQYHPPAY